MNIFIDAYNLLKQLYGVKLVSETQNNHFIELIKRFARAKKHAIFVVYDGGSSSRPEIDKLGSVSIIHSGYALSADDVIKQKIVSFAPEHTILVSDDRALCDAVSASGFATFGTSEFYRFMQHDTLQQQKSAMKTGVSTQKPRLCKHA